jgi:methylmalonyl-CoA/ethylmalonyl-CoA epimerase
VREETDVADQGQGQALGQGQGRGQERERGKQRKRERAQERERAQGRERGQGPGQERAQERAWQVIRVHHVAFAHEGGGDTPRLLSELLGLPCGHEEPADGFVERMLPAGNAYVQLLEATGPGVVESFLERRGPGLHHIAFEVSDLGRAVADLRGRGIRLVDGAPRPGGMGTRIAFVHPTVVPGLLIELVESSPAGPDGPG